MCAAISRQEVSPPFHKVGIIGLGLMGLAFAERLIEAGSQVRGFDINPERMRLLTERGGLPGDNAADVAQRCAVVILAVYCGSDVEGLIDVFRARDTIICTTTCSPGEMVRIAARAAHGDISLVEMPISGTSVEVRNGRSTGLVGGDPLVIEAVGALLTTLCPRVVQVGSIGSASKTKLAINLILQANRAALAEGIVFAERMGLDGSTFLEAAKNSAAYSSVMDTKGEKMLTGEYSPQSRISQTLKDAELVLGEARSLGITLPVTSILAGLLEQAVSIAGPDADSSAVIEAIRSPIGKDV